MNAQQSNEIALREAAQTAVAQFRNPEFEQQVALAVPEGVSHRQLLRAAMTAVLENPDIGAPALRPSLLQATLKCAQDGLLPDGREAAFVLYGGRDPKVSYQPMIGGLRKIAADHGWGLTTRVVYENDDFDPDYDTNRANHKPPRLGEERGQPIGAYAVAVHRDGRRELEVMDTKDIERVRQVSRASGKGPWVDWWERMAEKTVGKRLFKKLGMASTDKRVSSVLAALEASDPVRALYGPRADEDEAVYDVEVPAASGVASPPRPDAGEAAATQPAAADPALEEGAGEGRKTPGAPAVPSETPRLPTDEELDAAAAARAGGDPTFGEGRFEGMTCQDLWDSGIRGQEFLRWAVREWHDEPMRTALQAFADEHQELRA